MNVRKIGGTAALAIAVATFATALWAAPETTPTVMEEPKFSASTLAQVETCQSCHGKDGISAAENIPNLAGQKRNYIVTQLKAFKSGERKNELMAAIAGQLSDDDMRNVANYWSSRVRNGEADDAHRGVAALLPRNKLPADFPTGFTMYRSVDDVANGTISRNWANAVAVAAIRAGKPVGDGAVLVTENVAAKRTDDGNGHAKDANGRLIAGKATSYATMEAQAGWGADVPELLRNGNWHYAFFDADKVMKLPNQAQCLACHKPIASDDYIFTRKELVATVSAAK